MGLYLSLALFAALSSNLMLQFGLGLCSLNHIGNSTARLFAFRASALFCSVMSVWIVAFYLMTPMGLGLLGNVFLLPLTVLGHGLYSRALKRFFPPGEESVENYTQSGNSLSLVGSYLTLTLASALAEALVLALGFSLGLLFSFLLVREIEKRSRLEAVPPCLRGSPLLLISIGFLSLIFSSASALLLGAAGFF
jgi:electron transport complex protein RnfA